LSIADTLGFAGYLAMNVVYMSEIMGPSWRAPGDAALPGRGIFLLFVVMGGIIPHYWFPAHYRWFLWMLTILNALVAIALFFRMPESPRWLEAREQRDKARRITERMEARVSKGGRIALPAPDLSPYEVVAEEKTPGGRRSTGSSWWSPCSCWSS
jgi:MFS family permease